MVEEGDGEKSQCPICKRKFNPEAFEKHAKVCKKVFATKRKAFDSKKKRIIDKEHAMLLKNQEFQEKKKGKVAVKVNKLPKWKKQSEEFRAVCQNKDPGPSSVVNDDYMHCQYCNRNYNEQAYSKHLNFCMKKAKESQMKPKMTTNMKPNLNVKFGKK